MKGLILTSSPTVAWCQSTSWSEAQPSVDLEVTLIVCRVVEVVPRNVQHIAPHLAELYALCTLSVTSLTRATVDILILSSLHSLLYLRNRIHWLSSILEAVLKGKLKPPHGLFQLGTDKFV